MKFDKRSGSIVFVGSTLDTVNKTINVGDQVTLYMNEQEVLAKIKKNNGLTLDVEIISFGDLDGSEVSISLENVFGVDKKETK